MNKSITSIGDTVIVAENWSVAHIHNREKCQLSVRDFKKNGVIFSLTKFMDHFNCTCGPLSVLQPQTKNLEKPGAGPHSLSP